MIHTRHLSVVVDNEPELVSLFRSGSSRLERFFRQGSDVAGALETVAGAPSRNRLPLSPDTPGILASDSDLARRVLSGEGLAVAVVARPSITGGLMTQLLMLTTAASVVGQLRRITSRPVAMVTWLGEPYLPEDLLVGVDAHGNLVNRRRNMTPATGFQRVLSVEPFAAQVERVFVRSFGSLWASTRAWQAGGSPELREGFARLLVELFSDTGIVVIDEESPELAERLAPFMQLALSRSSTLNRAMRGKALLMRREGLRIDLPPLHMTNVRYIPGEREARFAHQVELREGRAVGRNNEGRPVFSYSLPTFLRILKQAPGRFVPGYRLRPLIQAWSLPVAAYIAAADDLDLHALAEEAYELLGLPTPMTILGHRLLLVPSRVQDLLGEYGLSIMDLWSDLAERRDLLIARSDRLNLAAREHHLKVELRRSVTEAAAGLEVLDPALAEQAAELTQELQQLTEGFFRDAQELHRRGNVRVIEDFRTMESWLRPRGKPQWHVFSGLPFMATYGLDLVRDLSNLPLDPVPQLALLRRPPA